MGREQDVVDNREEHRFELEVDGSTAIASYRIEDGAIAFTHTLVPEELEGQGVGSALVKGALAQVREKGLKAVPRCAFVRHYFEKHAEVQDLLA
jgi:predicted GNAT family acetyltransferase